MLTGVTLANNWIRQGTVERALVFGGEYISQPGRNAARHIRNIMSKEFRLDMFPASDPKIGHFERFQWTRLVNVNRRVKLLTRTDVVVVALPSSCR